MTKRSLHALLVAGVLTAGSASAQTCTVSTQRVLVTSSVTSPARIAQKL